MCPQILTLTFLQLASSFEAKQELTCRGQVQYYSPLGMSTLKPQQLSATVSQVRNSPGAVSRSLTSDHWEPDTKHGSQLQYNLSNTHTGSPQLVSTPPADAVCFTRPRPITDTLLTRRHRKQR